MKEQKSIEKKQPTKTSEAKKNQQAISHISKTERKQNLTTRGPGPLPCNFEFSPRPWGGLEPCSCALGCVGKKAGCMSLEVGDVLKAEAGFDEYFGGSNFGGRLPLDTGGSKESSELPFLPLSINVRGAGLDRWLSKENRFFLNSTALGRTSVALATRARKCPPLAPAPQFSPDPLCGPRMTLSTEKDKEDLTSAP